MKLRVFSGITINKYKTDVMKSGMQKYIRRGDFEKSLYCMVELDMFKKLNDKKVKGLRSNMRNRLLITLVEDCGISDWKIYSELNNLFDLWEKNRNCEKNSEREYMVKIIYYLCKSEKIRLCSWVKGYFGYCYKDEKLKDLYKNENIEYKINKEGEKYYKKGDSEEIKEMIDGIVYNLNNNNDNIFYWIMKILESKDKSGRRNRKAKKGYIVFDILEKYINNEKNEKLKELYNIHLKWFINNNNSRNENILFLLNIILFYLRRNVINWNDKLEKVNNINIDEIYNRNLLNEYNFTLDNYIIDMHCKDGKKKGRNEKNFVIEGSIVNNECNKFIIDKYKNMYNKFKLDKSKCKKKKLNKKKLNKKKLNKKKLNKKIEDDLEFIDFKELMNIEKVEELDMKLCREKTCGNKAMTFINKEKNIIVKEMRKSFNYGRDCCIVDNVKDMFEIKKMNCRRIRSNIIVKKKDKKSKLWKNNMKLIEEECIYLIMDIFDNKGSLVINKKKRYDKDIKIDYLKIVIFRGIFKVTDTNYTNVLINEKDELMSIDENNIGKRKNMIDRRMNKKYEKEEIEKVLLDIENNKEEKLKMIKKELINYDMINLYEIIENSFNNLRKNIYYEFKNVLNISFD